MKHKAFPFHGFKALEDEGEGVFEAIVAVFGNVDRVGDKIIPGAFEKSLATWEENDQPIPVIFSHGWHDPDALIGKVLHVEEREEGLYVEGQLDIENPFARKVWEKLRKGLLSTFSFGYLIVRSKVVDGITHLLELELLEVGPTPVPAQLGTRLIGVKELGDTEVATVQAMHDLAVKLGAKCSGSDGGGDSEGDGQDGDAAASKGAVGITYGGRRPSTLATRFALELIEAGTDTEEA